MAKYGESYREFALEVIDECSSTAYPEDPSGTHNNVISAVVPVLEKQCGLTKDSAVIEFGAGKGQFLKALQDKIGLSSENITAINFVLEDACACNEKGYLSLAYDMHYAMPWDHSEVELVVLRHILEHSPFPLLILRRIYANINKGAFVYVEVPSPDSWANHEFNANHYSVMGAKMWASLFVKAGFSIKTNFDIDVPIPQPDGSILTDRYFGFILEVE